MNDKKPEKQVKKQVKGKRGVINDKMKATQFEKGKSGNPNGRPKKGSAIADILNELLATKSGDKTNRELILAKVIENALKGDLAFINFIADRTEGKAIDRIIQQQVNDEIVIE